MAFEINTKYSTLKFFLDKLPEVFDKEGSMIWNGRNKIKVFQTDLGSLVVKKFRRPNIFQKIGYLFRPHKARKAYENGKELLLRGFNTPEPLAYLEQRHWGFLSHAYYICRPLPEGAIEIKMALERPDWSRDVTVALARLFAELHQHGVLHHDLNNTNILFTQDNGTYHFILIDINRISFYPSIDSIPMTERIENMTRFSGNYELFCTLAKEYAIACNIPEPDLWVQQALTQKKHHDRNWTRHKFLTHPWRLFT